MIMYIPFTTAFMKEFWVISELESFSNVSLKFSAVNFKCYDIYIYICI